MADQEEDPTQKSPFDFSGAMGAMGNRFSGLKATWDEYLKDPTAQAATMQFAINMMQPPSFGDTGMARIGRALGSAGEAVDRRYEAQRKEMESEAKIELAQARADRQRALGEAGDWKQKEAEARRQLTDVTNMRLQHVKHVDEVDRRNKARMDEWLKQKQAAVVDPSVDPGPKPTLETPMTLPQLKEYLETGIRPTPGIPQAPATPTTLPADEGKPVRINSPKDLEGKPPGFKFLKPGDPDDGSYRVWPGSKPKSTAGTAAAATPAPPAAKPTAPPAPTGPRYSPGGELLPEAKPFFRNPFELFPATEPEDPSYVPSPTAPPIPRRGY